MNLVYVGTAALGCPVEQLDIFLTSSTNRADGPEDSRGRLSPRYRGCHRINLKWIIIAHENG